MYLWLALLFFSAVIGGGLFFVIHSKQILKYVSIFGGAFLLAICFVDMLPTIFTAEEDSKFVAVFILLGFLLQLLLELISHGAEHGHIHNGKQHKHNGFIPIMLVLGTSLHAFFEGFALIDNNGINIPLLTGIIIHNIPVSVIIIGAFISNGRGKKYAFTMLSIFALSGVCGALSGFYMPNILRYQTIIQAFVVGILLHVSVSTLFDSEESHRYNLVRFLIVIAAFAFVFLLS